MYEAFLILDMAESHEWNSGISTVGPVRIPERKRPTMLQCSRDVAEREALRLQSTYPEGRFVLFSATHVTALLEAPTHVNLQGQVMFSRKIARLAELHDADAIPF